MYQCDDKQLSKTDITADKCQVGYFCTISVLTSDKKEISLKLGDGDEILSKTLQHCISRMDENGSSAIC